MARYKKKYNIYSMDQKEIIKNLNQKSSHNNYEISKSLNKVSNDKSYNKNKGKRRTIARNIIYNLLTQNNNNKITNIIIPKYKNTYNILKETKNAEKLSKYTFNDNENIIDNNENDLTYKNTERSNISYQTNIKNKFAHKKINEKIFKDRILIKLIKNFNINSKNNNKTIISPRLSAVIPMNELRDKLKNKYIKVNIRNKDTNHLRIKNFNINSNKSKNKDQKEIILNFV